MWPTNSDRRHSSFDDKADPTQEKGFKWRTPYMNYLNRYGAMLLEPTNPRWTDYGIIEKTDEGREISITTPPDWSIWPDAA
jgi:hypothetical protein